MLMPSAKVDREKKRKKAKKVSRAEYYGLTWIQKLRKESINRKKSRKC